MPSGPKKKLPPGYRLVELTNGEYEPVRPDGTYGAKLFAKRSLAVNWCWVDFGERQAQGSAPVDHSPLFSASLADALLTEIGNLDRLHQRFYNEWLEAGKPERTDDAPHEWEVVWARRAQVWQAFVYYAEQEKVPAP
jgi:hypothetical protein